MTRLLSPFVLLLAAAAPVGAEPSAAGDAPPAESSDEPPPAPPPRPPEQPPEPPGPAKRIFSVSVSPLHLVLPFVEVAAEFRAAPSVGVALIGGFGRFTDSMTSVTATGNELGGQLNVYLGEFSGLHMGVEALYLHVDDIDVDTTATAAGFAVGPYVGYKWLTGVGFTLVAQLGADFMVARAKTATQAADDRKIFPLVNLNVGWSF